RRETVLTSSIQLIWDARRFRVLEQRPVEQGWVDGCSERPRGGAEDAGDAGFLAAAATGRPGHLGASQFLVMAAVACLAELVHRWLRAVGATSERRRLMASVNE